MAYANDKYAEVRSNQASDQMKIDTIKTGAQFYWDEEKNFHNNYGRSSPSGWSFWLREAFRHGSTVEPHRVLAQRDRCRLRD